MTQARAAARDLTCLSTFSGLGGMDLGLEAAGFRHVGLIEWDEAARLSLKANRGASWPLLEPGDIADVAASLGPPDVELATGDLDLLVGAPPCQPYSKAAQWAPGSRRGLHDRRGRYLEDFLELARSFLPKVVLLENVRGFAQGSTSALPFLLSALEAISSQFGERYRIEHRLIDTAEIGVPQHRMRAIIIATRMDACLSWPRRAALRTAWDAIGNLGQPDDEIPLPRGKWAELLPSIPEGENYLWHTDRRGGEPLFGWRTRYWSFLLKLAKDRPSWTLPASPGPSTGPFHWDNRPLSIPEMLRLQSFPASWVVEGRNRVERVRQVGNATPPLLAEVLGRKIARHLGAEFDTPPILTVPPEDALPVPTPIAVLAPQFLELRGQHDEHPGSGLGPGARSLED